MGYDPQDYRDDPPGWNYYPADEAQPLGGTAMSYVITVSRQVNQWSVIGKVRYKPGVYVTEDEELAETAKATLFGVHVRPVLPGEEIEVGPYGADGSLTRGSLEQSDMKGANNPHQTPSREEEVRKDSKDWDYSRDPALDPDYVPHSKRTQTPTEEADVPVPPPNTAGETEASEEPSTVASFEADQVDGVPI